MTIKTYLILSLTISTTLHVMSSQQQQTIIYAIPGLLGNDFNCGYSQTILNLPGIIGNKIIRTGTLSVADKPDLGQKRCINHLKKKL